MLFVIVVHPMQQCCSLPEYQLSDSLNMKVSLGMFSKHECVKVLCVTATVS